MVMTTLLSSMSFSIIDSGVCFVLNNMPHDPNALTFCLCRLCSCPPQPLDRPDGTTVTFQVFFPKKHLNLGHFVKNRLTRLHRLHLKCRNRCLMMGRWLRDWTWTKQQLKKGAEVLEHNIYEKSIQICLDLFKSNCISHLQWHHGLVSFRFIRFLVLECLDFMELHGSGLTTSQDLHAWRRSPGMGETSHSVWKESKEFPPKMKVTMILNATSASSVSQGHTCHSPQLEACYHNSIRRDNEVSTHKLRSLPYLPRLVDGSFLWRDSISVARLDPPCYSTPQPKCHKKRYPFIFDIQNIRGLWGL